MTWLVVLLVIAVGLSLGLSPDPRVLHRLNISELKYRVAITALLIPYMLIWFSGFFAFSRLLSYTKYLKGSKEGVAFSCISKGMGVLAFGLVIPTILSQILNYIARSHLSYSAPFTVFNNYIGVLVPVIALTYIASGSRLLISTTRVFLSKVGLRFFVISFLLLSTTYTYLVLHNYDIRHSYYHLSAFFLLTTLVVPYLYAWFYGLLSASQLRRYSRYVKGVLYRKALVMFATGITVVVIASITIQFITSIYAIDINHRLGTIILVDYGLLGFVAAGMILIALASNKLKKIEEV